MNYQLPQLSAEEQAAFDRTMGKRGRMKGWQAILAFMGVVVLGMALFQLLVQSANWFAPSEAERTRKGREELKGRPAEERVYPPKSRRSMM